MEERYHVVENKSFHKKLDLLDVLRKLDIINYLLVFYQSFNPNVQGSTVVVDIWTE